MSDLKKILARREEIAASRKALEAEDAELAVAERVLRKLSGDFSGAFVRSRTRIRIRTKDSIPLNYRNVLDGIRKDGGTEAERSDVLDYVNSQRSEPLAEPSFAARISKMVRDGYITREGSKLCIAEKQQEDSI